MGAARRHEWAQQGTTSQRWPRQAESWPRKLSEVWRRQLAKGRWRSHPHPPHGQLRRHGQPDRRRLGLLQPAAALPTRIRRRQGRDGRAVHWCAWRRVRRAALRCVGRRAQGRAGRGALLAGRARVAGALLLCCREERRHALDQWWQALRGDVRAGARRAAAADHAAPLALGARSAEGKVGVVGLHPDATTRATPELRLLRLGALRGRVVHAAVPRGYLCWRADPRWCIGRRCRLQVKRGCRWRCVGWPLLKGWWRRRRWRRRGWHGVCRCWHAHCARWTSKRKPWG
mmetsp:Transcript_87498/g.242728  ORF Transcript_87498/g.242728 Transcript_87498/m.242728 type:complete len:287 (-) Transcript_87498:1448-2308(-)